MILKVKGDTEPTFRFSAKRKTIRSVPKNTIQIVGKKYLKNTVADEDILKVLGGRSFDIGFNLLLVCGWVILGQVTNSTLIQFYKSTKLMIIRY